MFFILSEAPSGGATWIQAQILFLGSHPPSGPGSWKGWIFFLHGCPRATALFSLPEALTVLPHSASCSPAAPPTGLPRPCLWLNEKLQSWVWEMGWCLSQESCRSKDSQPSGVGCSCWLSVSALGLCTRGHLGKSQFH